MDRLLQDLRYAVRRLVHAPGFTLAAVLTLALGIGANTTIFSAVNAFLLRPADAAKPEELVRVYRGHHSGLQHRDVEYLREHGRSFAGLFTQRVEPLALQGADGSVQVMGELVSGEFFPLLGIGAALGRVFGPEEDAAPGANPVVVLSHRYWTSELGADPSVVGRSMRLNGRPHTVIGVAREGFEGPYVGIAPDLWIPFSELAALTGTRPEEMGSLSATARLRPGVSREQAEGEIRVLGHRLGELDAAREEPLVLRLDHARGVNAEMRGPIAGVSVMLLAVVALVLLTACANLAGLLLARSVGRRREMGIRVAVGAGRRRLVLQLLTESVILALLGGAAALLLTNWTSELIRRFVPSDLPIALDLSPDGRVLLFTLATSIAAGLLFGLAPALRASSPDVLSALKGAGGYHASRLRSALVVAQVTLSVVLLGTAALFLRSLGNAQELDPGFEPTGVLDLSLNVELRRYTEEQGRAFYARLVEEARALPGVRSVALARIVPLSGNTMETSLHVQGRDDEQSMTHLNVVGSGYFETLGIEVARGREFVASDDAASLPVAVVNEAFARRHLAGGQPVGQRVTTRGSEGPYHTVVGVVRDAKYASVGEDPLPTLYLPFEQSYGGQMTLHVRADGNAMALREPLSALVESLDPLLPHSPATAMTDDMRVSLLPARMAATLLGVFGSVALLLSALGIYGVVSYAVAQRTREIGIRAALGAARRPLLLLMLRDSTRWLVLGLTIGLPLTILIARLARGLLHGVGAADPALVLGVPALLAAVGLLASYLPARRATRVDPTVALRAD